MTKTYAKGKPNIAKIELKLRNEEVIHPESRHLQVLREEQEGPVVVYHHINQVRHLEDLERTLLV
jgi:hypothetical protein